MELELTGFPLEDNPTPIRGESQPVFPVSAAIKATDEGSPKITVVIKGRRMRFLARVTIEFNKDDGVVVKLSPLNKDSRDIIKETQTIKLEVDP